MTVREAWRDEAAELMRLIASSLETMAQALDEDDDILGALAADAAYLDWRYPEPT